MTPKVDTKVHSLWYRLFYYWRSLPFVSYRSTHSIVL